MITKLKLNGIFLQMFHNVEGVYLLAAPKKSNIDVFVVKLQKVLY